MKQFLFIIFSSFPFFLLAQKNFENIQQSSIQQDKFLLSWSSKTPGISAIEYGLSPELELGIINSNTKGKQHQVQLSNLQAATFYYARPLLIDNTDTLFGPTGYYTSQSNSTGVLRVLFNKDIDSTYSTGTAPYIKSGGANIENEIISMINQAKSTIDIAVYNTTRNNIITALKAAHNNGIQVRYIVNDGTATSNTALSPAPGFSVFYANPNKLMHHKFMIIDADSVNQSWVWTGSGNWTLTDMYNNYNHWVAIQDQALALTYRIEFEEMWGSNTAIYDTANSKVGAQKIDNTPHTFNIGGRTVESYFSPSDGTTGRIVTAINSADNDLKFCVFSYTRNELGTAVRDRHAAGIPTHGIMQNINDNGSEFPWLTSQGVNILAANYSTNLHHKYAIIDAEDSNSDPLVVTGSHNWTTAAETANDENTLIIHDATTSNIFLQEFALRWCQVKNNIDCTFPSITTSVKTIDSQQQNKIYPNPTNGISTLQLASERPQNAKAILYNNVGQQVLSFDLPANQAEHQLNLAALPDGVYFLSIPNKQGSEKIPLVIIH